MRKTIEVDAVLRMVNTILEAKDSFLRVHDMTPEQAFRLGNASLLEQILHATGNYKGYSHLSSEWDPDKLSPLNTCKFCGTTLHRQTWPDGHEAWVDETNGGCCWGDDNNVNENELHVPKDRGALRDGYDDTRRRYAIKAPR